MTIILHLAWQGDSENAHCKYVAPRTYVTISQHRWIYVQFHSYFLPYALQIRLQYVKIKLRPN